MVILAIACLIMYMLIAFSLWWFLVNTDLSSDLNERQYVLYTMGCLLWPVSVFVVIINGWLNHWE